MENASYYLAFEQLLGLLKKLVGHLEPSFMVERLLLQSVEVSLGKSFSAPMLSFTEITYFSHLANSILVFYRISLTSL